MAGEEKANSTQYLMRTGAGVEDILKMKIAKFEEQNPSSKGWITSRQLMSKTFTDDIIKDLAGRRYGSTLEQFYNEITHNGKQATQDDLNLFEKASKHMIDSMANDIHQRKIAAHTAPKDVASFMRKTTPHTSSHTNSSSIVTRSLPTQSPPLNGTSSPKGKKTGGWTV